MKSQLARAWMIAITMLSSGAMASAGAQGGAQGPRGDHITEWEAAKLLFDANSMYTSNGHGAIYKFPKNGIKSAPQVIGLGGYLLGLDGSFIYYLSAKSDFPDSDPQALMKIPKTGGKGSVVIPGSILKDADITSLVFDANNIYASLYGPQSTSRILQVDRQTLKVTVLTRQPTGRLRLVLVKGQLFWGDDYGSVKMIDLSNSAQVHIVADHSEPTITDFITDGQNLFMFNGSGQIKKYSPGNHTMTTVVQLLETGNPDSEHSLSTDGKNLYWIDAWSYSRQVYQVPVSGGQPQQVDLGSSLPVEALGTDAKSIYYSVGCQESKTTSSWTTYQTDTWQQQYVGTDGYIYNGTRSNTYPVNQSESECVLYGGVFRVPKN